MRLKQFFKDLVVITKANQEFNERLNKEIKAARQQVGKEKNEVKVLGFPEYKNFK